jgi:hypothetical protein
MPVTVPDEPQRLIVVRFQSWENQGSAGRRVSRFGLVVDDALRHALSSLFGREGEQGGKLVA